MEGEVTVAHLPPKITVEELCKFLKLNSDIQKDPLVESALSLLRNSPLLVNGVLPKLPHRISRSRHDYKCGHCGQKKKNHVCILPDEYSLKHGDEVAIEDLVNATHSTSTQSSLSYSGADEDAKGSHSDNSDENPSSHSSTSSYEESVQNRLSVFQQQQLLQKLYHQQVQSQQLPNTSPSHHPIAPYNEFHIQQHQPSPNYYPQQYPLSLTAPDPNHVYHPQSSRIPNAHMGEPHHSIHPSEVHFTQPSLTHEQLPHHHHHIQKPIKQIMNLHVAHLSVSPSTIPPNSNPLTPQHQQPSAPLSTPGHYPPYSAYLNHNNGNNNTNNSGENSPNPHADGIRYAKGKSNLSGSVSDLSMVVDGEESAVGKRKKGDNRLSASTNVQTESNKDGFNVASFLVGGDTQGEMDDHHHVYHDDHDESETKKKKTIHFKPLTVLVLDSHLPEVQNELDEIKQVGEAKVKIELYYAPLQGGGYSLLVFALMPDFQKVYIGRLSDVYKALIKSAMDDGTFLHAELAPLPEYIVTEGISLLVPQLRVYRSVTWGVRILSELDCRHSPILSGPLATSNPHVTLQNNSNNNLVNNNMMQQSSSVVLSPQQQQQLFLQQQQQQLLQQSQLFAQPANQSQLELDNTQQEVLQSQQMLQYIQQQYALQQQYLLQQQQQQQNQQQQHFLLQHQQQLKQNI